MEENIDVSTFIDNDGKLKSWPSKRKYKFEVLKYLGAKFGSGEYYSKFQVKQKLISLHCFNDHVLLRRELIDNIILSRTDSGSKYCKLRMRKMNIEITRFKVRDGKSHKVDEWMQFLNSNMKEVLLTLVGEKMYVETIFRETLNGVENFYLYSVQGEGGTNVESSKHDVNIKHIEYWNECIDDNFKPLNMN